MLNGVLNVWKERGYSSHDVVAKLRGILHQKKIGHTGTLDPDAEGVLPVCLGNATKLCDMLTEKTKCYRAVLLLGITTDTQDISGAVLKQLSPCADEEKVRAAIFSFIGDYDQIPPMYSALKVNGQKLIDLARRGIEVERKPRRIHIYDIRIEEMQLPRITVTVECSKGSYIRTLCHDIGEKLGCGGCMEQLLRTRSGSFSLAQAKKLSEIEAAVAEGGISELVIPTDRCLAEYPALHAVSQADRYLHNGNPVAKELLLSKTDGSEEQNSSQRTSAAEVQHQPQTEQDGAIFRVYDSEQRFIGLYCRSDQGLYRPKKIFSLQ